MKSEEDIDALLDKGARLRKTYLKLDQELKVLRGELLMKIRAKPASGAGIRSINDRGVRLCANIAQREHEFRALRTELLARGRPDLAGAFLVTPLALRDLAGFFFRREPIITFRKKAIQVAAPALPSFPAKFSLEYRDGENGLLWRGQDGQEKRATKARLTARFWSQFTEPLSEALLAKLRLNFHERFKAAQKVGEKNLAHRQAKIEAEMRELLVQMARAYPLEEWLGFFLDASLAGQIEFIKDVVDRHCATPSVVSLPGLRIAFFWSSFEPIGLADKVPGLKHWSDKAACDFSSFISRKEPKPSQRAQQRALWNYQTQKSRHRLRSEEPTLVSYAEYKRKGKTHILNCER